MLNIEIAKNTIVAMIKPDMPAIAGLFIFFFSRNNRVGMPIIIQPATPKIIVNAKIDTAVRG